MQHAYFYAGDTEAGVRAALSYAENELGLQSVGNPDVVVERYGLFSVEDARSLIKRAELVPVSGDSKVFIIAASRFFHEAQNALLKLFEEPPKGTTIVVVIPSEGNLIGTLRSRMQPLGKQRTAYSGQLTEEFVGGNAAARERVVAKILAEAKSDEEDEKLAARAKALRLAEGLARAGYVAWRKEQRTAYSGQLTAFLQDLDRLVPILHDRAAPLKPILEHILLTAPRKLS